MPAVGWLRFYILRIGRRSEFLNTPGSIRMPAQLPLDEALLLGLWLEVPISY